jgi:hypothetical protein
MVDGNWRASEQPFDIVLHQTASRLDEARRLPDQIMPLAETLSAVFGEPDETVKNDDGTYSHTWGQRNAPYHFVIGDDAVTQVHRLDNGSTFEEVIAHGNGFASGIKPSDHPDVREVFGSRTVEGTLPADRRALFHPKNDLRLVDAETGNTVDLNKVVEDMLDPEKLEAIDKLAPYPPGSFGAEALRISREIDDIQSRIAPPILKGVDIDSFARRVGAPHNFQPNRTYFTPITVKNAHVQAAEAERIGIPEFECSGDLDMFCSDYDRDADQTASGNTDDRYKLKAGRYRCPEGFDLEISPMTGDGYCRRTVSEYVAPPPVEALARTSIGILGTLGRIARAIWREKVLGKKV